MIKQNPFTKYKFSKKSWRGKEKGRRGKENKDQHDRDADAYTAQMALKPCQETHHKMKHVGKHSAPPPLPSKCLASSFHRGRFVLHQVLKETDSRAEVSEDIGPAPMLGDCLPAWMFGSHRETPARVPPSNAGAGDSEGQHI